MQILITGATGFIGRQLVARLTAAGHKVTCCLRDVQRARLMFPKQECRACDARLVWIRRRHRRPHGRAALA